MKLYRIALVVVIVVVGIAYVALRPTKQMPAAVNKTYVALGDSVAAGVGIGNYTDSSACNRSTQSYPVQLAQLKHYKLMSFACSGATLQQGVLGSQTVNNLALKPQFTSLINVTKPNLITITIGANDAHWTDILGQCYRAECSQSTQGQQVASNLQVVQQNLTTFLSQVKQHYNNKPPTTVLTGYYQVFPAKAASCSDLTGLDANELAWGRQLQTDISNAVAAVAQNYPFVTYVPLDFSGHELCTSDSWVQGLFDKQPYHPTKAGQSAIAQQIMKALQK